MVDTNVHTFLDIGLPFIRAPRFFITTPPCDAATNHVIDQFDLDLHEWLWTLTLGHKYCGFSKLQSSENDFFLICISHFLWVSKVYYSTEVNNSIFPHKFYFLWYHYDGEKFIILNITNTQLKVKIWIWIQLKMHNTWSFSQKSKLEF